ncbi:bifunctional riboflavin kinase/FAD synthetase [Prosthecochloris sp. N3]|uniref:Riboflavin biosynthesis protein n=1 Tax=Prosthecochloris ethylica TaxID=2743976 RepID=A0ABR9XRY4_9CHLB|nr:MULTISPECIES: bifunctional riboflavin kinase/FAD synthetase [Prosthecochloris]MEC9487162.1 bifunctional riboflavin kinase/FAD synthetase [Prosthecochloris sp.]MBF0586856.1 bifunctional riboflavin kinase/FAD synthetase [Prosthecochloris ethylica]MBF0636796.1 bifunctional riboflavin kinase/FAD synthetase [Prosthecochloris ethylica]NUK48012.1 bifunctional riboflavin kinase/FAD synthetase [Prosthecochloris ethylica]RNA64304.1 bifunctional riboflavin kinase/FAD synthetase [Prosthecochloris sp. Z
MQTVVFHNGRVYDGSGEHEIAFQVEPSAVTVGSYDGVHAGHRRIISHLLDAAETHGLRSVVVTFDPHPRQVIGTGGAGDIELLTLPAEKQKLLAGLGVDCLFIVRFDEAFSRHSSEWFITHVLEEVVGARRIVIGYDHGFGRDRKGSGRTLRRFAERDGFAVDVVDEVRLNGEHFSSTRIRSLLREGRVAEANVFLGAPYMMSGRVVRGQGIGRDLGFPTVNIELAGAKKLLPKQGVYIAEAEIDGRRFRAMMNFGTRPTVSSASLPVIEAHLLGYSGSLYGCSMVLYLLDRLRDERRFASLDELRRQLEKDKKSVELFSK